MTRPTHLVTLRAATSADRDFLLAVFASTRANELALLAANTQQRQAFINLQFNAQQQSYDACYPAAENSIIVFESRPIGRMLVDRPGDAIILVDIAILNEYRNRGIGSFLIRSLMDDAAAAHKVVRLSVYKLNPAIRLYERLGFSRLADDGVYFAMTWVPADL